MVGNSQEKLVVFTDLDGTLLDARSYSFEMAVPALRKLRESDVPVILCSSKTRKEIEHYRMLMGNEHPFVTENGGGVFTPVGYFFPECAFPGIATLRQGMYEVIVLGTPYAILRNALRELKNRGCPVKGFGDMTVEEVAHVTGLSREQAEMAKERDFDEPFLYQGPVEKVKELEEQIRNKGLTMTQGEFFHILGNSDKGKAVDILTKLYREKYGNVVTIGLGDSPNDIPMLERVDYPVQVMKRNGSHDPRIQVKNLIRAEGIGPVGWNGAVKNLLKELKPENG